MKNCILGLLALWLTASSGFASESLFSVTTVNPYHFKNGKIVSFDYNQNSQAELFVYDFASDSKTLVPLYGTIKPYFLISAFNGVEIVYVNFNYTNKFYIDYHNIQTKESKRIVSDAAYKEFIWCASDKIVWIDYRNLGSTSTNSEVYSYNLATGAETRITNDTYYQANAVANGDYIAWVEYHNNQYGNIVLYNTTTAQTRFVDPVNFHQDKPILFGDYLVWEDYRNTGTDANNVDIYMYDIKNNAVREISTEPGYQSNPFIDESIILWDDYKNDNTDSDISAFDLNSNDYSSVAEKSAFEYIPQKQGTDYVWIEVANNVINFMHEVRTSSAVSELTSTVPSSIELAAYPNPFNPALNIQFSTQERPLDLSIYCVTGAKVYQLDLSQILPGQQTLQWRPYNLPSGNYYIKLITNSGQQTRKVMLIK
ncbi:MAG: T9SS type A sorting domain-containing protein [Deferribacteres bacterium]|nr:T9SS type A sorting domain-containing protein [candidate division KSB1 bacterium]MCB9501886.1 T9SS type A sorting domain-containing protein [Deferribacteres bacterium]